MSNELKNLIEKEAEEQYALTTTIGNDAVAFNNARLAMRKTYIAGATRYAERVEELEAKLAEGDEFICKFLEWATDQDWSLDQLHTFLRHTPKSVLEKYKSHLNSKA